MKRHTDEPTLRALVDAGVIREAVIVRIRQTDGDQWAILVKYGLREQTLRSRREPIRRFNTLDTAAKLLHTAGLSQMTIDYS